MSSYPHHEAGEPYRGEHINPAYPPHPSYSTAEYPTAYARDDHAAMTQVPNGQGFPQHSTMPPEYPYPDHASSYPPRDSQSAGNDSGMAFAGLQEAHRPSSRGTHGSGGDLDLDRVGGQKGWLHQLATPNKIAFISTVLIQITVVIVMISIVFHKINENIKEENARTRSIAVYLSVFGFAAVYQIIITLDALRLKNTIQLIGVCIFNVAMLVYGSLMIEQVKEAIQTPARDGGNCRNDPNLTCYALDSDGLFPAVRRLIIVIPVILGVAMFILAFLTFRLYKDFGWDIYKQIGADLRLKRMYMWYQVFACFLKFDAFFWVGFAIQFLVLVLGNSSSAEFTITIIALPFTLLLLVLGAIATRKEIKPLMLFFIAGEVVGLVYFIYKLYRIFAPAQEERYDVSRRTLATFSIITIIALIFTLLLSIKCYLQFGRGLKDHIPPYLSSKTRREKRMSQMHKSGSNAGTLSGKTWTGKEGYGEGAAGVNGSNGLGNGQKVESKTSPRMELD